MEQNEEFSFFGREIRNAVEEGWGGGGGGGGDNLYFAVYGDQWSGPKTTFFFSLGIFALLTDLPLTGNKKETGKTEKKERGVVLGFVVAVSRPPHYQKSPLFLDLLISRVDLIKL